MTEYQPEHRAEEEPLVGDAPPHAKTLFSNEVYDHLKWVAQVALPALALFYLAIAPFWGLPKQEEVAGTVVALDLLLGTLLGVSTRQYKNSDARFDGEIVVAPNEEGQREANLKLDSSAIATKKEIVVKIDRQ